MKDLTLGMYNIERKIYDDLCKRKAKTRNTGILTLEEKNTIKEATESNLVPGCCSVYWDWTRETKTIWGLHGYGLHCALPFDELHTMLKGPIENILAWSFDIFYTLEMINGGLYGSIIGDVDKCFQEFPYQQAVTPVPVHPKKSGLSPLFSKNRSRASSHSAGTGMGTGGTPAAHLPGMLFVLLYSIGENGNLVPDEIVLPDVPKYRGKEKLFLNGMKKPWKCRTIIVNAIQSSLSVLTFSRKDEGFTEEDLEQLGKLIANSRAHLVQLFAMRSDLKQMHNGTSIATRQDKSFAGIKHHALDHLPMFIEMFGLPRYWDTQRSENYHTFVKAWYERISQRIDTIFEEIGKRVSILERLKFLSIAVRETRVMHEGGGRSKTKISILEEQIAHLTKCLNKEIDEQRRQQQEQQEQQENEQQVLKRAPPPREIIRLNDILEKNKDCLYSSFYIADSTQKVEIEYVPESMRLDKQEIFERGHYLVTEGLFKQKAANDHTTTGSHCSRDFLYPYLDLKQLFTYVWNKTPDGRSLDLLLQHCMHPGTVRIKLNEKLSSKGANDIGISPFVIHCNARDNSFSAVEVNFGMDVGIVVVRIGAIITLELVEAPNPSRRTVLVGYPLKRDETRKKWGCPVLQYETCRGALEVVVFDLTSIIRPACLIPEFTKLFPVDFKAQHKHQLSSKGANPSLRRYFHESIPQMHCVTVFDWIERQQQRMNNAAPNGRVLLPGGRKKPDEAYVAEDLYLTNDQLMRTEHANISLGNTMRGDMEEGSYDSLLDSMNPQQDEDDGDEDSF